MCSAAVLGYALESFVDVWSSILVLWRFWGDGSSEAAAAMAQREKWASFGISMSVSAWHPRVHALDAQACTVNATRS